MKINQLFIPILCTISLCFLSCSDNDKVKIIISQEHLNLTFEAPEERQTIQISADGDWNIKASSDTPWCTTSHEIGTGEQYVNVYVDVNNTNTNRSASIVVSGKGAKEIIINVTQHKNKLPEYTEAIAPDATGMNVERSSMELSKAMKIGFNVGNTYDAIFVDGDGNCTGDETSWGNLAPGADLFRTIKAAGFNFVRLPLSFSHQLVDPKGFEIKAEWFDKIAGSVDAAIEAGLYVMINIHHEGHWLHHVNDANKDAIYERFEAYWKQIALRFRNYDEHLLFAGMNEVQDDERDVNSGANGGPIAENFRVHNSLNQMFVNTVRATGGRNSYRHLVVQSYITSINYALSELKYPSDVVENRSFLEVHYYDPWEFCIKDKDYILEWGKPFADAGGDVPSWGLEDHMDKTLRSLNKFTDKNIPVMVGEWGAPSRERDGVEGEELARHLDSRDYYYWYMVKTCLKYDLLSVNWDTGHMIDRRTCELLEASTIDAMMAAVNGEDYVFRTIK